MTRHSRNCTANSVYSYHEKRNDAKASGFGSLKMRYSKDAIKDFDCCCITLHPCRQPMVTQEGYIFDKESILEYIIAKKNEIKKKQKEYEKQANKEKTELEELGEAEARSKLEKFLKNETTVAVASQAAIGGMDQASPGSSTSTLSNLYGSKAKKMPSFWMPAQMPDNNVRKIYKPDKTIYCPMSGKPIKFKDLFPVKFTQIDQSEEKVKLEGKNDRYKCPVTGDLLRNNVPTAVIKTTGDVITAECVKLIKKDMRHPLTGDLLTDTDIILLQRGGTGFAETNEELVGVKARPVMQS